jgi:hypothetical protein
MGFFRNIQNWQQAQSPIGYVFSENLVFLQKIYIYFPRISHAQILEGTLAAKK